MNRRKLLQAAGAAAALSVAGAPAIAQSRKKVKVGYLHTLAVDGQIWTGMSRGTFAKEGVDLDLVQFTTGLELFQAMIGGSIDMLATGAVLSNFPARGQGKAFLINNVEFATAQLWVREDMGVKSFADLKGKKISTTTGTTAHVFLDNALRANNVDPTKDVELVNQRMAEAVTSMIISPRMRMSSRGSSAHGWRRTTTSSPTPMRRSRRCRRTTTSRCRSPISRNSTRRRRCSPRTSGARCTPTARSPNGCSR